MSPTATTTSLLDTDACPDLAESVSRTDCCSGVWVVRQPTSKPGTASSTHADRARKRRSIR